MSKQPLSNFRSGLRVFWSVHSTAVWISGFIAGLGCALYLGHNLGVRAQLSERPGCSTDNPIDTPRDLSGSSIKNPLVLVVHTTDAALEGGSMYL